MNIGKLQAGVHDEDFDYAAGSPHIKHTKIRTLISTALQDVVQEVLDRKGECRVLEVGAGHGTFTDYIVAVGATAIVTEMSGASVAELHRRYRHNQAVEVVHDADGSTSLSGEPVDVVACISVLHHIPDYEASIQAWSDRIAPGGAFISFQDPILYARRTSRSMIAEMIAYMSWRILRGNLTRGISTRIRQARGRYDETNPSDMVEYHVMRGGVDEVAILEMMRPRFDEVKLTPYWSTQGSLPQTIGEQICAPNTFGVVARGYRGR